MAKKQNNMGIFERAGYALGASKSPAAGFDYVKGIAVAMEDMDRIDASIKKTQDLLKKNPNGVEIPKLTDALSDKTADWLAAKKPLIADAHEKMRKGTDEEKEVAIKYLNDIEKGIVQLNGDFENAALKQDEYLAIEKSGTYAVSNNEEQKLNFHNFANGTFANAGEITEDENGMPRLTYNGQVWDQIDIGNEYNYKLEDTIDAELTNIENMAISGKDWNKNATKRGLEKIARDPKAVKDYMYQNPELMDAFISNQVSIPQMIDNSEGEVDTKGNIIKIENPAWNDFKAGIGNVMPRIGDVDPVEKIPQYDDYFNSNKSDEFLLSFTDGFVNTVMDTYEKAYTKPSDSGFDVNAHE